MKIHPLGDRILIKRVDEEEQVSGGIIIPDTAKEKQIKSLQQWRESIPLLSL